MNELLEQKLKLAVSALDSLARVFPGDYEKFTEESLVVPSVERYFQLLVDAVVDCNQVILEMRKKEPEETYFGTFTALADEGVVTEELAQKIAPSVGLRNALVHRYENIERRRVYESIKVFIPLYRDYIEAISK